jgi:hypothetical protein
MSFSSRLIPGILLLSASAVAARSLRLGEVGAGRAFDAEYITEVKLDRFGFLWIGTREGLYLHDGHHYRKFQSEGETPRPSPAAASARSTKTPAADSGRAP